MNQHVSGVELSRRFYHECVRPLLAQHFPGLVHAAAFVGYGSDVLGYDTSMSTDHGWSARVSIFVTEADHARIAPKVVAVLRDTVPADFAGHPTIAVFDHGTEFGVRVETVRSMILRELHGFDFHEAIEPEWWLTLSEQQLLHVTAGEVFHDAVGELTAARRALAYYPHDVWLYLMAAGWQRIGQEEAFVGRAGSVGDELGSAVIAARLVRDLMRLCFLIERKYAPYSKWFGSAFVRLHCAKDLGPIFKRALAATDWHAREQALSDAYRLVAKMHNELNVTNALPTEPTHFYKRPFTVIHGGAFARALRDAIKDPIVRAIAQRSMIGSIDQFSDSTDLLSHAEVRPALRQLYTAQEKAQG